MGCASSASQVSAGVYEQEDFHTKYLLGEKLGRGSYGQVHVATRVHMKRGKMESEEFAVKILDLRNKEDRQFVDPELLQDAHDEATMWFLAKGHANIVKLKEVFDESKLCYLVMEKCSSELFGYIDSLEAVDERSLGTVFTQMFRALAHVHSLGIVHRDIKPDNFLVGGEDAQTVKLTDFGLSQMLPASGKLSRHIGTAPFTCPEMLHGRSYDTKADVWSMGVLAYVIMYGDFPYVGSEKTSKSMRRAILIGMPPKFGSGMAQARTASVVAFIRMLLSRDPAERPLSDQVLKMPYLDAVAKNKYMVDCELPCLRAVVHSAKKVGAFSFPALKKRLDVDDLVQDQQYEKPARKKKSNASLGASGRSDFWFNTSSKDASTRASGHTSINVSTIASSRRLGFSGIAIEDESKLEPMKRVPSLKNRAWG